MNQKTVILITGPTASGKTPLAIRVAKHFGTEIISADSRQCFIEMNIGVAKPSDDELASVTHYFINSHSIHEPVNAAIFADYAHEKARHIFSGHDVLVLTGGTGLYIKAFLEGLDDIPDVDPSVRESIKRSYNENGIAWLQEQIELQDPLFYASGETKNPQRLMRALEVKLSTGTSICEYHKKKADIAKQAQYHVKKYAIDIPREQLYVNISNRVENMIEDGLLEEVMELEPHKNLNALQTVGYSELFDHLDGRISLEEAIAKVKQNTRNYAKRQLTWLRKEDNLKWITGAEEIFGDDAAAIKT